MSGIVQAGLFGLLGDRLVFG